jgi:hypothetical protein
MPDEHHNKLTDRDVSRVYPLGAYRCGVGRGGDLKMLAIHPYTVTVRERLAPLLAAAKQTIPNRRSQACAMGQVGVKAWSFPHSMLAWKL